MSTLHLSPAEKIQFAADIAAKHARNKRQRPLTTVSRIGFRLKQIFHDEIGRMPCGSCAEDITALNGMTPSEAQSDRKNIIARISARALRVMPTWRLKAMVLADKLARTGEVDFAIGMCLDMAIEEEREATAASPPGAGC